jgi:hypothetical protein
MNQWGRIFDKGYSTGYELGRTDASARVGFVYKSSLYADSASDLIDGTWHHVALVKQGTLARLYADGDLESTISVTPALQENAFPFLIGYNPGEGIQGYWKGLLDELKIFDRALSATEITALATILEGDFNADGKVDAADYVVWRKNGMSVQDYAVWRSHFGETAGGGMGAMDGSSNNVPEPLSFAFLLIAAAWHWRRRSSR